VEHGAVVIEGDRIVAVGPARSVSCGDSVDYQDAVICPGFVNAHTHLELTNLAGRVPPSQDFTDWLRRLMAVASAHPPDRAEVQRAFRDGLAQSFRAGVTLIGDVTRFPDWTRDVLANEFPVLGLRAAGFSPRDLTGLESNSDAQEPAHKNVQCANEDARSVASLHNKPRGSGRPDDPTPPLVPVPQEDRASAGPLMNAVSFGEVISIGTRRNLLESKLSAALDRRHRASWLHAGVSPHAPYTVEPDALRICAERAAGADARICIHLAETPYERKFTVQREGPFADYLRALGVWDNDIPISGLEPIPLANATGVLTPRTIVAHANYVSDADIDLLAGSGASVAYCPRTHHAFGHVPHRFLDMLEAGVNVCVGTDSLASNPSLSILDELRFLHRTRPETSPETLLRMGTRNGSSALGWGDRYGTITVGLPADLVVIPLTSGTRHASWTDIFTVENQPLAVYVSGSRVAQRE